MIISLSGKPGSGKSTVAEKLSAALGYDRIYIGAMRREMAKKRGMTLAEFNAWSEHHEEGDKEFDAYIEKIGKERDNFVIEGRTAFHFIPHSIKVFLEVDLPTAAKRIYHDARIHERNEAHRLSSVEDVQRSLTERINSDRLRYEKYYHLDTYDHGHYDLVVDTSGKTIDQVYGIIMNFLKNKGTIA